ncbi:MAG: VWA domain-containing protein [Acidobacteriota bacterium]|nr:VWA domain-containing protein [Acidobacteriota bacterium]
MQEFLDGLAFAEPLYLWLLVAPALLAVLWVLQVLRRRRDARAYARLRLVPFRERFTIAGDLGFWLAVLVATSLCIVALARPTARVSLVRRAGADFVLLQDGSSSMYVDDVDPDRWQRSVRFLRTFSESLSWKNDRVALALFASLPAPQVRLTADPNALFFFLDHLGERSPFRLEDITTWDTNIEEGVFWGLQVIERDEEVLGPNNNPKAFVVLSDGQAWSGDVAIALALARQEDIPVHVVGVGSSNGGFIPESIDRVSSSGVILASERPRMSNIHSVLDRDSLRAIARAGGGEYYELGTESDRDIAFRIITSVRRRAPVAQEEESVEELYWWLLATAAGFLGLGVLVLKRPTELWWQAIAGVAILLLLLVG